MTGALVLVPGRIVDGHYYALRDAAGNLWHLPAAQYDRVRSGLGYEEPQQGEEPDTRAALAAALGVK